MNTEQVDWLLALGTWALVGYVALVLLFAVPIGFLFFRLWRSVERDWDKPTPSSYALLLGRKGNDDERT